MSLDGYEVAELDENQVEQSDLKQLARLLSMSDRTASSQEVVTPAEISEQLNSGKRFIVCRDSNSSEIVGCFRFQETKAEKEGIVYDCGGLRVAEDVHQKLQICLTMNRVYESTITRDAQSPVYSTTMVLSDDDRLLKAYQRQGYESVGILDAEAQNVRLLTKTVLEEI